MTKIKIALFALIASVSLSACMSPPLHYNHRTSAVDYKRDVYVFRGEDLNRADIKKVQRSLAQEGYYKGSIDGIWGVETSQAILDYQSVRYPGQTDVTVDTLQEFGIRMDRDNDRTMRVTSNNR